MTRYALVVGIQKYGGQGFGDLKKPVEDAEAIAQILEAHGDFVEVTRLPSRWNEEKQRYEMTAARLTGVNLEQAIIDFFEKVGSNEALIYFSGHGFQVTKLGRKKGYLVTSDCTTDTVATAGIALEDLNGLILDAALSSLVVLLDCCHGGSLLEQSQISTALGVFRSGNRNYFLATACRSHEKAYEGTEYSLFTAAVLKALQSPGVDGRVRTAKLNQVIDDELRGSGQEPVVLKSGGEITLVTYAATGKVEIDEPDKLQTALNQLRSDYDILDVSFFKMVAAKVANNQARAQILRLRAANWSMLFQKNYVERDQQGTALEQALRLSQNAGISLLLIRGEPGAGKTALLRWLAYELFGHGKLVFHKKSQSQIGWLEQLREFSEETGGAHFYVIADDLFRDDLVLEELQQNEFLFPLTLIGTTRKNEDRHTELQGAEYETVCLDLAKPSAAEKERVLALPEVQDQLAGKSVAERQQLMNSPIMLVLMLQLSEGKPFDVLLWDIIKNLSHTESQPLYQTFGVLCSFFQHDIIVPFEILQFCLPESNWSERLIFSGLAGLIDTATYGGYEGLTPVHELIAKTVMALDYRPDEQQNQPYGWIDRPPLLERHLRAIVSNVKAIQRLQTWWISDSLGKLAKNQEAELVRKMLRDYPTQIEAIQQQNAISEWAVWAKIYTILVWSEEEQRCIRSILLTHPNSPSEWVYWLSLTQKFGSRAQQQTAITQTQTWLDSHSDDWHVRVRYLGLVERLGSREQQQAAITQTQTWLDSHPDDGDVRVRYLGLVERLGNREQQQAAITQTQTWLDSHSDDWHVRVRYLGLVERLGSREQQQAAIVETQTWLYIHPDDWIVRSKFLGLVTKTSENQNLVEGVIQQQWQWMIQQHQIDQSLWNVFLPVLRHHASPDLYPLSIQLVLQQHPDNASIASQVFGYFRDYLDYTTCCNLATRISQYHHLPVDSWQNRIHAANFFRDHDAFDTAEKIYNDVICAARKRVKQFPNLQKTIDFADLSYAQLLLLINPPQTDQALQKLHPILKKNPKHGFGHLLMAQSYQAKGSSFYINAKTHFEKAIQFDREKHGFFYYQFGCFYRYAVGDVTNAYHCFEQSLAQKLNFSACLEFAELEALNGNLERAKSLLQDGLALTPVTRPEKEERGKKDERIRALQSLLGVPE